MALRVRRASSIKVRVTTTVMTVFALVAQPLYGFMSEKVAGALSPTDGDVAIESLLPIADTIIPSAPNNLGLKVTENGRVIPNDGFTNKSGVTATWKSDNTESVSYIYKYWNDVTTSQYKQNNPRSNSLTTMSNADVVNEGEGKHYFCLVAKDLAGNESACSATYGFTYDATAPNVAIQGVADGQTVTGDVDLNGIVTDQNPMNSYFIITGPNGYSQSSLYRDGRAIHNYLWKTTELTKGTYKIQFEARDRADNKDKVGGSIVSVSVDVNNHQPTATGENFTTHSDVDYKGIDVRFNITNFKTVTGVSVDLYGAEDNLPLVTNTHNQKLLDLIADGETQLNTPFIITPGSHVEESWNLGSRAWTRTDQPVKAVVTVTGTDDADISVTQTVELTPLIELNDVTFLDLLPVVAFIPVDPELPVEEETVLSDNGTLPLVNPIATGTPLLGNTTLFGNNVFTPNNHFVASTPSQEVATQNAAVLGTQDTAETPLASTAVIAPSSQGWKIYSLAWYWWVLIAIAAMAAWMRIAAGIRRFRGADDL